jgi:hypothetical protein
LKFDAEFNLEWERVIEDRENNVLGYSIQQTYDDGYIITGTHISRNNGDQQAIIIKSNKDGYQEWSETFGGFDEDEGRYVLQTLSDEFIVIGETKSYGSGDIDGWIVKFSSFNNQPPNKPSRPSGPINGGINEEHIFTSSTIDLDNDQMYYWFDWGDDSDSGWLGPYNSGEECSASHIWNEQGNYEIKVKVKDIHNGESEYSDPLTVSMPKSKNTSFEIILQLFKNHPVLQKILQLLT